MFMPEARFPDEKFWDKDGSAIRPAPKGPPKGTTGKTHFDLGVPGADQPSHKGPGFEVPALYPNIHDVKREVPDAYKALASVLNDLDVSEDELPEEAFLYDEDGNITVTIPHSVSNDMTHELVWNKSEGSWEYVI